MSERDESDSLSQLEELVPRIPEAKAQERLGKALDDAVAEVNNAGQRVERLEQISEFIPLVRGHIDPPDWDQLQCSLDAIQAIGQMLSKATDSETLLDISRTVPQRLIPSINQADQFIKQGWRAKINRRFSSMGLLGGVLEQIPETQQLGTKMKLFSVKTERLAETTLNARSSVQEYKKLEKEQKALSDKLAALGVGEEVVEFLLAVAAHSATLSSVSEAAKQWLGERHLLPRFKVEF